MDAWLLCSKEDVMSLIPIKESEIEDFWSEAVEGMIRQHLGMPYLGKTQAITGEKHNGDGTIVLRVNKPPIDSVSSLVVDGATLLASDYHIFTTHIQLKYLTFTEGSLNVEINYTSGTTAIDSHIRLCAAAMIVAIVNYRRRFGADASIKWGTADQKQGESTPMAQQGLTEHLVNIMKKTLKRSRVRVY